jgi:UDP-N-acetylglucosamine acyltransferase
MSGLNVSQALQQIQDTLPPSAERDEIVNFITSSSRGVIRGTM